MNYYRTYEFADKNIMEMPQEAFVDEYISQVFSEGNESAKELFSLEFESGDGKWYRTVSEPQFFVDFTAACERAADLACSGVKYRVVGYEFSRVRYGAFLA